ncbi:MAG: SDR family NAD(P)-dependent oxidoreductase [Candidatus Bathyarchaeota archaeon]|nr:MAG: SDR family NAD(P)-dependent oxidoreductase [Candidatus Bathyarchaeota archaeon]
MKVLIVGNGGVSKGFQKVFAEQSVSFDIYHRSIGDLYEMPQKIKTQYDLIIYAVGNIVWKPVRNNTAQDIEEIFKPNAFGFFVLAQMLPQVLKHKGKVVILGANMQRITSPFLSLYAASKSALKAFVEVAKREMRRYSFYLLEPEEIDTPIWKKVPVDPQNPKSPEDFARETLDIIGFTLTH